MRFPSPLVLLSVAQTADKAGHCAPDNVGVVDSAA